MLSTPSNTNRFDERQSSADELSPLQDLCAQFTEKAGVLVDLNERALQLRTGGQRDTDEEGGRYGEGGNFQGNRRCAFSCFSLVLSREDHLENHASDRLVAVQSSSIKSLPR